MNQRTLESVLRVGESVAVEFKRCGSGIEHDVYESVCSFLNRFGGDIFLGVLDDGTVLGIPEKAAPDMIRNFISVISNPGVFSPTVYLEPETVAYEGCMIIHVHVPPSSEVHSYKKVIYDRVDDADVRVTSTGQIAAMYIRKQNIFTEKKIYPYVTDADLRLDLLPRIRQMAVNHAGGIHPWENMDDIELLKSAGLYGIDLETGRKGYNLAAIMLLGKDDIILNACPAYMTDALVRRINVDRYDDREIIQTNLLESYELLLEFGRKHLSDKFYLEDGIYRKSLRGTIVREMVSNVLMHREFTSSYIAKFVIEKGRMYVENANRAFREGVITPDNLEPNPKNPIIASFFRNIGYADQLGSGVRNLFKYAKFYSGKEPEFKEGDVFRITVPLEDSYSYDFEEVMVSETKNAVHETKNLIGETKIANNETKNMVSETKNAVNETKNMASETKIATKKRTRRKSDDDERTILLLIKNNPKITQKKLHEESGIALGTIKRILPRLQEQGFLVRTGSKRSGEWIIPKQSYRND
ncbi:MAG: putative DNA binding domain-containing protein [Blautia sp.]|nr:putative DNA binding domain-containing protein [Blautia sp.]